ncbi:site-specific integrase [Pseudomonas sp. ABY48]|uniref:site-specific integrase n=1 Tax=Pseudomonas sp. ABY48 TaxID=3402865 RepID=UPI003B42B6B8
MTLSVRRFTGSDGERHAMLMDEAGMPLFYPTLWVTVALRGSARAVNTIHNALSAIKCLYAWQDVYALDVEQRFSTGALLKDNEVHSLRDFLQESRQRKVGGKVVPFSHKRKAVSSSSQYARMTVAAEYLEFLARRLSPSSEAAEKRIAAMVAQIKANRPNQTTKTMGGERDDKHLEDSVLDALEAKLKPGAEENPFTDYSVQFRNALMFAILRTTGIRRGELLNLKVDDIDFAVNILRIVRRPDSPQDIRRYQPVAKTRERQFPIDAELANRIHEYVARHRSRLPGAKRHGYLFVVHKEGPYQGAPMSNSAFSKFIEGLKEIVETIHAHKLRHHWNYSFSSLSSEKGLSVAREEKLRSYLMGWEPTSGTAAIYNRRHIKKEAGESMLALQSKMLAKKLDSTNE